MNKLSLSISPCPNDTFMFDAWVNKRLASLSPDIDLHFDDIKSLNESAMRGEPDVTKLSLFAAGKVNKDYEMLTSGAALGYKNGPLIISKKKIYSDELPFVNFAIPGKNTTANLLLQLFYKPVKNCKEYFFYEIEDAILGNEVDAGVIIHETRFTYQNKGLQKIVDLGEIWEERTKLPLPLGVIAVKRSLPEEIKKSINRIIKESVLFAFGNPDTSLDFIRSHAQETDKDVVRKHIDLYVNEFSVDLGDKGKQAISKLLEEAVKLEMLEPLTLPLFIKD